MFTIAVIMTLCADAPHSGGKWLYRLVDGQRCYFQAEGLRRGRHKPREELSWPKYGEPPDEPTAPMIPEPEGTFKWRWIDPTGRTHQE